MTSSIILIVCFIIFIFATETIKGWRLSNIQKISFSCIPLSILSCTFLSTKFDSLIIPLLAATFWFGLGTAILLIAGSIENNPHKSDDCDQ